MNTNVRELENQSWTMFSETGVMPTLPEDVLSNLQLDFAREVLKNAYNPLVKLLVGEFLLLKNSATNFEIHAQLDAAEFVRMMILSKKKNYSRKEEMYASLIQFCRESKNGALRMKGKFLYVIKGLTEKQQNPDERKRKTQLGMGWLQKQLSAVPEFIDDKLFVNALLSVGWNFYFGDDLKSTGEVLCKLAKSKCFADDYSREQYEKLRNAFLNKFAIKTSEWKKARKSLPGQIALNLVEAIFARDIDLDELPGDMLVRKENPQGERVPFYPSTIEKIAKGIHLCFKAFSKGDNSVLGVPRDIYFCAIHFLENVYSRKPFDDDKWGKYRIGTLLIWSNQRNAAIDYILPIARREKTQFWVWDLLAKLYPEFRKECIARALLLDGEDVYKVNIVKEAAELQLPMADCIALEEIAKGADKLLVKGLSKVKAVYCDCFENSKQHKLAVFAVSSYKKTLKIPFQRIKSHALKIGCPVYLYSDSDSLNSDSDSLNSDSDSLKDLGFLEKIVDVDIREDGCLWDVLQRIKVVYGGISKNGNSALFYSKTDQISARLSQFPELRETEFGKCYYARFIQREKNDGIKIIKINEIKTIEETESDSSLTRYYEGEIRFPHGLDAPAFVGNVYVPVEIHQQINSDKRTNYAVVQGWYVVCPDGRKRAYSIQLMTGENLERYCHMKKERLSEKTVDADINC